MVHIERRLSELFSGGPDMLGRGAELCRAPTPGRSGASASPRPHAEPHPPAVGCAAGTACKRRRCGCKTFPASAQRPIQRDPG
ncbi:unnamed protein product [Bursaphelenchus xylophilus]|uniref:(pine wood nematode) hypothetical protein n=1 Tax=Bursaphelenchus xylophilus TaxID=6326 RepID=A0A7I8XKG4_BURXY|nr:unnamed protein product [Bursaphelenchus xylophilus]CAG9120620.1 unnamed protein product [Bursaphelenchus xylophilus]